MKVNTRSLVSLLVAAGFLVLTGTGLLLFFVKHDNRTAAIHTLFGLVFLGVAVFHIRNNFRALKGYGYKPQPKRFALKPEFYLTLVPAMLLLAGLFFELPGFAAVYEWGNRWRSQQANIREERPIYQHLETNVSGRGVSLELEVRKGSKFQYPLFAVWIESPEGQFLQTLYVSKAIGSNHFTEAPAGVKSVASIRRPEALPYWGHRRGIRASDGYYLPDAEHLVPDVVSAATATENWRLHTKTDAPLPAFTIYFEVNQSWDWNDYYTKDRFPDDPIYSGNGQNGQPSVVYAAAIDLSQKTRYYALNPVGHGHHSGKDGTLDPDLSVLTTALEIVDGVTVKVLP
ncbi:hypothetical protein [Pendulispora albinea]|uniref:DUF4405 domain-containing protein n=1 Tax=Pendulispora albinea TaxID=2741071 RepID=A0ABZ2MAL0_9BACT